jgi:hypothetical protein
MNSKEMLPAETIFFSCGADALDRDPDFFHGTLDCPIACHVFSSHP